MKYFLLIFTTFFMSLQIFGQKEIIGQNNDTVTIFINGKNVAEFIIKADQKETDLPIKKMAAKTIKKIVLQIKGQYIAAAIYKKSIKISGAAILIDETKGKPGNFNIFNPNVIKELTSGKKIPLYLMLEPANPMMMISSKIIFLGNLMMK